MNFHMGNKLLLINLLSCDGVNSCERRAFGCCGAGGVAGIGAGGNAGGERMLSSKL